MLTFISTVVEMCIYAVLPFFTFSSSPSDAEFDAVIGYLEDIIMGKLCKQLQTRRWVLNVLPAALLLADIQSQNSLCLLHGSFPSFVPVTANRLAW